MMRKNLLCAIVAIAILIVPTGTGASANNPEIVLGSIYSDQTGYMRVVGHITAYEAKSQVTFLALAPGDEIAYINQIQIGNNGTFLFECSFPSKYSEDTITIRIGSNTGANVFSTTHTLSTIPPGIENVENNSVLYGCDVYTLDSIYLASDYVYNSIFSGGNRIYYKIGDLWYNLMDSRATSAAFLVPENAVPFSEVQAIKLGTYYIHAKSVSFR